MNADRFLAELPQLFEDFPRSEHPRDRGFQPIVEQVKNLASENILALLNLAASCLGPDESYVEVGVYHGASLIAAMLGNEDKRFVGIDSFVFSGASLEKVEANLERLGVRRPELLVGDAFELVPGGALRDTTIGVWYYDAAHDYELPGRGLAHRRAAACHRRAHDRRRHRLDTCRAGDGRLRRRPAACRTDPHDRRQEPRRPALVGRNADPPLVVGAR